MVSFILCLLPALLATSAQAVMVTCKTCPASANSCPTGTETCKIDTANGGCYMVAEVNTLEGTQTKAYGRGCLNDKNYHKDVRISFTVGKGKYLRLSSEICGTDNCNSGTEVPTGSTTENGLQCPTCLSLSSETCESPMIPCTGDENYCVDFTGTVTKGSSSDKSPFVAKGCSIAFKESIKDGGTLHTSVYIFTITKAAFKPAEKITNDGASLALGKFSFALYLPGLTALLLLKLLS
ncbi:phospholipase A2 inhibitor and Ly6/PLAUR domain-containing protein-like [Malaclemys terrapin pileata]|uniref:phospholipase A2 inhibitor and Ly6/PLAUR domain-containing protein-like n=1 Tax=Malaclemys terrapin pileata TaxID=2991368 RepID=UPI0023A87911|nr:phospholipase A2 inhibitor and Ly6/PLAUR domain-containing protein-like [Malaclemys terrapin pileata]